MCVLQYTCGIERLTFRSGFFSSMWVPGMKRRLLALKPCSFTHCAIFPALHTQGIFILKGIGKITLELLH